MAATRSESKALRVLPVLSRGSAGRSPTRSADQEAPAKRRGRPPGIDPERRQALADMARAGLTLAEIAVALGVSRQCVHQQLAKCGELETERQVRKQVRRHIEGIERQFARGIQWAEKKSPAGAALAKFLRDAMAHGWAVEAAPRRRPRVNGARLAFHLPHRTRAAMAGDARQDRARYFHVQLTRPDWLHVVCLPTGRYVFYLPDLTRRSGSYYIPVARAHEPQRWPAWHEQRALSRHRLAPARSRGPAWAA